MPARQGLLESTRKIKRPPGRPLLTLTTLVKNDLSKIEIDEVDINVENQATRIMNYFQKWRR